MGSFISGAANTVANTAGQVGLGGVGMVGSALTGMNNGSALNGLGIGGMGNSFSAAGATGLLNPAQLGLAQNIQNTQGQLNNTANQLQGIASGAGPNPAQIQLQQGTNRAIQQNTGMLASQKGISPALAQRLAAQNAAQMSQMAAGQGAALGAQQQMNAINGLSSQALGNQNILQNALASWNNNQVGMQSNLNNTNAQVTSANSAQRGQMMGGLMQGAGAGLVALAAQGGEACSLPRMADGGVATADWGFRSSPGDSGPSSFAGQYLNNSLQQGAGSLSTGLVNYASSMGGDGSDSGGAGAGPTGNDTPGSGVGSYTNQAATDKAIPFRRGGPVVPGKAAVKGDSLKNDTVPAMLSPKEIVLPRSVTMHPNAPQKAAEFVAAVQAKNRRKAA